MTLIAPFIAQVILAGAAFFAAPIIARRSRPVWVAASVAALATMMLWPLMRVFPVQPIELLGARAVACIELTGLAIPAGLLFGIAAGRVPRESDRRAILLLVAVAAIYFVKAGWWMVWPAAGGLGPTRIDARGVCRQSTTYTCVAASMVTMLRSFGIEAEEAEMARLSRTQAGGGATDSRALWALEEKLRGTPLRPVYRRLDSADGRALAEAVRAGPCLVQLDWGYFVSHMVPVLSATHAEVLLGDPLSGARTVAMPEFLRCWKGTAIMLERPHTAPHGP